MRRVSSKFRVCMCILLAPQSLLPKLENTQFYHEGEQPVIPVKAEYACWDLDVKGELASHWYNLLTKQQACSWVKIEAIADSKRNDTSDPGQVGFAITKGLLSYLLGGGTEQLFKVK